MKVKKLGGLNMTMSYPNKKQQQFFVAFPWVVTSTGPGGFIVCVYFLWQKHLKTQQKVVLEKPGIEPETPDLQGIALIHYTMAASEFALNIFYCSFLWKWVSLKKKSVQFALKLGILLAFQNLQEVACN